MFFRTYPIHTNEKQYNMKLHHKNEKENDGHQNIFFFFGLSPNKNSQTLVK